MLLRNIRNQQHGAQFEALIISHAFNKDILAVRNGQVVRWLPGGKTIAVKSNLDWTLISKEGVVAFADTKSFQGWYFTPSKIDERQLQLAVQYRKRGCPAGFIVYFRETLTVVYFDAFVVSACKPRSRLCASDGRVLGTTFDFDLRKVFTTGEP